jgi:hypothetical protein
MCQFRVVRLGFIRFFFRNYLATTKLIIQIPCLNEAETLPDVIRSFPRSIPGIDRIAFLVIDDGSTDCTSEVAKGKKWLQRLESWFVSQISKMEIPDVTSGFRAYSREAALRLTVHSSFSYTLETLIQGSSIIISVILALRYVWDQHSIQYSHN